MHRHPSLHAKERANERFGLNLTAKKHKQIIHQIHSGKAIYTRHDINTGRGQWIVKIGTRYATVVYCAELNLITTVMKLNKADMDKVRALTGTATK